ncbi:MAG: hypothetical protein ABEK50_12165 [bacterium]
MSIVELAEYEDEDGDYIAVWMDSEDNTIVVQYNFINLTLAPENFKGLVDALDVAADNLEEQLN